MSGFSMLPDLHFTGGKATWADARRLPREGLAQALVESRNRTLAWLAAFGQTRKGWMVTRQYDCNPPLWTLGHIAWHAEWWCLRGVRHLERGGVRLPVASEPSLLDGADEWFDPDRIGPDERWEIVLPDVARVKQYATQVLDGLLRRIALLPDDEDATLYPFRRALFHEDAQGETEIDGPTAAASRRAGMMRTASRCPTSCRPSRPMCPRSIWTPRWSPTRSFWNSSKTTATSTRRGGRRRGGNG